MESLEIWGEISASFFLCYPSELCKGAIYYGEYYNRNNEIEVGIIVRA
tara:strand:- start:23480 stop:23623 length:144 start_codon:yes stop_codon:yes gene_type:complete